jgi:hypothetical protein
VSWKYGAPNSGELSDEAVGLGAADIGMLGTEFIPSEIESFVGFGVADLFEAGDTGSGTLVGERIEGLFPAYPSAHGKQC